MSEHSSRHRRRGARSESRPPGRGWRSPTTRGLDLVDVSVFDGADLALGRTVGGPALIEYPDTTVLVPEGWDAIVDESANLVVTQRKA